jgi:pyruvate, water dikinase
VPVDIEFACDGDNLYLLQCRPQSSSQSNVSVVIPKDILPEKILFSANRYVSNGIIPDVYYIVYVDPIKYSEHKELTDLKEIGRIVGKLNKILPKKRFILMGPGRWGSRDDIRLGVKVTYSDINNTAILIEIARKKGNYAPDLSFGTHFFQDLVEAQIQYLPLYPDDPNVSFNEAFLLNSENHLTRFLPDAEYLADTIKLINVREVTNGSVLRILMNADDDEAVALISDPQMKIVYNTTPTTVVSKDKFNEPLQWRLNMIDSIVSKLDNLRFGVKEVYLFGSTFNHNVQANSDINLLFHFEGNSEQRRDLMNWLDGWNLCLSEINFYKTGFRVNNILDINIKTDEELASQEYYSALINPRNKSSKIIVVSKRI